MSDDGHFHFLFEAEDYEKAVAFYEKVLGLPIAFSWDRGDDRGTAFTAAAGVIEVLSNAGGRRGPKRLGAAVQVPDVDAVAAGIAARGGEILHPPLSRPWGTRETVVVDPDGNAIVFFAILP
jgi:predicted enzyme related to lactoylglutathione lyase